GTFVRRQATNPPGARQLGLLIPGLGATEIFGLICGELASLARATEYTLLWGDSTHPHPEQDVSEEHAVQLCEQFIERRVAGVFLAPFEPNSGKETVNRRIVERFQKAGL